MPGDMGQIRQASAAEQAAFTTSIKETLESQSTTDAALNANKMEASAEKLQTETEDNSAMGMLIKSQKLIKKQEIKTEKAKQAQESVLIRQEDASGLAGEFSQRQGNREYQLNALLLSQLVKELGETIKSDSDPDEVIAFINKFLSADGNSPDVSVVDKTLEFLLEVAGKRLENASESEKPNIKALLSKLEFTKNKHYAANAKAISVAQKIIGAVDAVIAKTGETVKETLDHYRDVVHNPPDVQTLRKFYESKGFKAMVLEFKGLSSFLGGNFKRTNLDNPELMQLAVAARKMQALLGVFRQSKAHIPTVESFLELNGILFESEEEAASMFANLPEGFYDTGIPKTKEEELEEARAKDKERGEGEKDKESEKDEQDQKQDSDQG